MQPQGLEQIVASINLVKQDPVTLARISVLVAGVLYLGLRFGVPFIEYYFNQLGNDSMATESNGIRKPRDDNQQYSV